MKEYIKNLHARPSHEKRRYSMRVAAACTAAVFLIWLSTLGLRLQNNIEKEKTANANINLSGIAAVTASVGGDIASKFGQMKSSLSAIQGPGLSGGTGAKPAQAAPAQVISIPASSVTGGSN